MPTRILSPLLKTGILTALATALITVAPYSMAITDFDGDGVAVKIFGRIRRRFRIGI